MGNEALTAQVIVAAIAAAKAVSTVAPAPAVARPPATFTQLKWVIVVVDQVWPRPNNYGWQLHYRHNFNDSGILLHTLCT